MAVWIAIPIARAHLYVSNTLKNMILIVNVQTVNSMLENFFGKEDIFAEF